MDTYNVYMDELPTGEEFDGEEMVEVEFRVVPATNDDGDAESNAVIAGRAKPNSMVTVFEGEKEVGEATTGADGKWRVARDAFGTDQSLPTP